MQQYHCKICGGSLTAWPERYEFRDGAVIAWPEPEIFFCNICGKEYPYAQFDETEAPIENFRQDSALGRCCALAQEALLAEDEEALEQYCDQIQELDQNDYHSFLFRARLLAKKFRRGLEFVPEEENQVICHYLDAYRNAPDSMKPIFREELLNLLLCHAGRETFGYGFAISKVSLLRRWFSDDQLQDFLENLINISFDKVIAQARTFHFASIYAADLAEAAIDAFPDDKAGELCELLKEKYTILLDLVTAAKGRGRTPQQEQKIEKAIYLVTEEKKRYDSLAAKGN